MQIWNLTAKSCLKCHESERKCVKKKEKSRIRVEQRRWYKQRKGISNQVGENQENGSKAAKRQKHLKVEVGSNVQYCSDVKQNNPREMTTRLDKTAAKTEFYREHMKRNGFQTMPTGDSLVRTSTLTVCLHYKSSYLTLGNLVSH